MGGLPRHGRGGEARGRGAAALPKLAGDAAAWVDAYARRGGLYRLDQAQRRLESWVTRLVEEPSERALRRPARLRGHVQRDGRGLHRGAGSGEVAAAVSLAPDADLQRGGRRAPRPVAYFLVDAMRFEMGMELFELLPKSAEVSVRAAATALPSITPICMAAVLPGASRSFNVVAEGESSAPKSTMPSSPTWLRAKSWRRRGCRSWSI